MSRRDNLRMQLELADLTTDALASVDDAIARAGQDLATTLDGILDEACEQVVVRVVERYVSTSTPRLLQALTTPEQCPPDYPQAAAWARAVTAIEALLRDVESRAGAPLAGERDARARLVAAWNARMFR